MVRITFQIQRKKYDSLLISRSLKHKRSVKQMRQSKFKMPQNEINSDQLLMDRFMPVKS